MVVVVAAAVLLLLPLQQQQLLLPPPPLLLPLLLRPLHGSCAGVSLTPQSYSGKPMREMLLAGPGLPL